MTRVWMRKSDAQLCIYETYYFWGPTRMSETVWEGTTYGDMIVPFNRKYYIDLGPL